MARSLHLSANEKAVILALRASKRSSNVSLAAPTEAAPRTFATKAERLAGKGFPCTVPGDDCGRRDLRTPNRASIHGIDAGGHGDPR